MITLMSTSNNQPRKLDEYTNQTAESMLAKIDAGIRDADAASFASEEQVQAEFARWRGGK
jgi:predicted transcriptional regulator